MNNSNVSVVLINYNSKADTLACLYSLQQSSVIPFVVLVDNASTEGISEQEVAFYPSLHFIKSRVNLGFGGANNLGIDWVLSNREDGYVFILNNDTEVEKKAIQTLLEPFNKEKTIGMTTCKIVFMDEPNLTWYGGGELDYYKGRPKVVYKLDPKANESRFVTFASGCAMMFKRETLKKLKGFDRRFFMYVEDVELCIRMQQLGSTIYYTSQSTIFHKVNGSFRKKNTAYIAPLSPKNPKLTFYAYHIVKNNLLNASFHFSVKQKMFFYGYYFIFCANLFVKYLIHGRLDGIKTLFRAFKDFRREKIVKSTSI